MKKSKKKEKSFFYLIILMAVGAFIGGLGSGILYGPVRGFVRKSPQISRWIIVHSGAILYICVGFFSILGLGLYLYGKREFLESIEKEQELYSEKALSASTVVFAIGSLLSILAFGLSAQRIRLETELSNSIFIDVGVLIIGVLFFAIMEKKIIKTIKKGYPEKEGDPYDMSFEKVWLESMDEREKEEAYYAGFKTFQLMNKFYMVVIVFIVLLSTHMSIQILTYLILSLFILVSNLTYLYYCLKEEKNR